MSGIAPVVPALAFATVGIVLLDHINSCSFQLLFRTAFGETDGKDSNIFYYTNQKMMAFEKYLISACM
jgi:hypothetical protein